MFDLALAVTLIPPNGGYCFALVSENSHSHQTPTLRITIIEMPRDPTDLCSDASGDTMWTVQTSQTSSESTIIVEKLQ